MSVKINKVQVRNANKKEGFIKMFAGFRVENYFM